MALNCVLLIFTFVFKSPMLDFLPLPLSYTYIGDSGLEILTKSCKSLIKVSLGYCGYITDSGIQSLIQNCRKLRELRISNSTRIDGIGFKGCSSTLASLEASSSMLSGLTEVLSGGGLENLDLSHFLKPILGHGLAVIGSGVAANLRTLNLKGCRFVTDDAIKSISKGCPLLQEWNLGSCENITISGWESIGFYCQCLERIHVTGCVKLCDRGLLALGNGCRNLSVIYMKDCPLITASGIQLFKTQCENVEISKPGSLAIRIVKRSWGYETIKYML